MIKSQDFPNAKKSPAQAISKLINITWILGPNKGILGPGLLILFIAVILVTAIAASVLIASGTNLQNKAYITGNDATEAVGSGIEIVSIRGTDPSASGTPHEVTKLIIFARLPSGSGALKFNTTVLNLDTIFGSQGFTYGGVVADDVYSSGTNTYVVTYLNEGPEHLDGYISNGDMAKIKIEVDGTISEQTKGRLTFMPNKGNVVTIDYVAPESMTNPVVVLWPLT